MHCFGAMIEPPNAWPDPPSPISFSTLRDIEKCPRRWGLRNASYSQFENSKGYPPKPSIAGARGLIVHRVIEEVIRRAKSTPGDNFRSRATAVLRDVGGLSKIVGSCIEEVLRRYAENPRADYLCKSVRLTQEISSQVRVSVQQALQNLTDIQFPPSDPSSRPISSPESVRHALFQGLHTEVSLHGPEDWFGKADLLLFSSDGVCIEDFKSGKPKEDDVLQLLIYAWLWWRDSERNPKMTTARRLVLRYLSNHQEVPAPTKSELQEFERQLLVRTEAIQNLIRKGDPPANVSTENCSFCPVRQLCEPYWLAQERREGSGYIDVEVLITKILSPRMWRIRFSDSEDEEESADALVTGCMPKIMVKEGAVARILGARIAEPLAEPSGPLTVLRIGQESEVHIVRAG